MATVNHGPHGPHPHGPHAPHQPHPPGHVSHAPHNTHNPNTPPSLETLHSALSAIKTLRSTVGLVFETFGNGLRVDHGEEGKETKFLVELQELLSNVNNNLRDVETAVGSLNPPHNPFNLGNTSYLSQENSVERQSLYQQLVLSYRWTDKVHEYCTHAHGVLGQNTLTRSYTNAAAGKRRRNAAPSHSVPQHTVDKVINQIDRVLPEMTTTITRPFASNAVVHIVVGQVLKAIIAFKGLMIEWVVVKGYTENWDMWSESRYKVFQKISDNSHIAIMRFHMPPMPDVSVKNFLTWLHSFNNLFSATCKGCGLHLQNAMPPTWRECRTLEPFHEECKP